MVAELFKHGIICDSKSLYASQVLMISKKCGEKRLCVDYRALNKITELDQYPIPMLEDRLSGCKYFCSLDLASGYYQIKLDEESIPKTAFVTQDGHYEFLRVPFGLTNAPFVFQRAINKILGNLRFTKVIVYLDDILIPGKTIEETLQTLKIVLDIFRAHNNA